MQVVDLRSYSYVGETGRVNKDYRTYQYLQYVNDLLSIYRLHVFFC